MKISGSQFRWLVLVLLAAAMVLLRIFRHEWLKGKNPLLILIILTGIYLFYRLDRK